jgi:hypothetical protein
LALPGGPCSPFLQLIINAEQERAKSRKNFSIFIIECCLSVMGHKKRKRYTFVQPFPLYSPVFIEKNTVLAEQFV